MLGVICLVASCCNVFSFSAVRLEKLKIIFAQEVIIQRFEQDRLAATLHHVLLGQIGLQTQHVLQVVEE